MAMFFVAAFFYFIFGYTALAFLGLLLGFSIPEILGNYIDEKRGVKVTKRCSCCGATKNAKTKKPSDHPSRWAYDDLEAWKAGEDY